MDAERRQPLVKKITTDVGFYLFEARSNRLLRVTSEMYEALDYFGVFSKEEIINRALC